MSIKLSSVERIKFLNSVLFVDVCRKYNFLDNTLQDCHHALICNIG